MIWIRWINIFINSIVGLTYILIQLYHKISACYYAIYYETIWFRIGNCFCGLCGLFTNFFIVVCAAITHCIIMLSIGS
jgi:hypothetical protein